MRLFKVNTYQFNKRYDLKSTFIKAREIANKTNGNNFKRLFYFADSGHGKTSAVERAIKKFPSLEKFKYFVPEIPNSLPGHFVLSNLSDAWQEANPNRMCDDIDLATLEGVANGIPKSFPFMYATFIFAQIDWFGTGNVDRLPAIGNRQPSGAFPIGNSGFFSPSIIFQSNWGLSKRELTRYTALELETPCNSNGAFPELNENVKKLLSMLGKIRNTMITAIPSEPEKAAVNVISQQADKLIENFKNDLDVILSKISFSHSISTPESFCGTMDNVSPQKSLSIFKKRGYKYLSNLSGRGVYCLAKRTERNNQIILLFDFAPMARTLAWLMEIQGPFWKHVIQLKFHPNTPKQYAINGQTVLDAVVENAGDIADSLENTIVKQIEDLYGPAPSWFEYQK